MKTASFTPLPCLTFVVTVAALALTNLTAFSDTRESDQPPASKGNIDRALTFLARDALAWKAEHDCSSCHHAALVVWSMNEAKLAGHKVDEQVLADMTRWLTQSGEGKTSLKRPDGIPKALNSKALYFALGLTSVPNRTPPQNEALDLLLRTVQEDQTENGSWASWPDTRPPIFGNSDQTMTAYATLALLAASVTPPRDTGSANNDSARIASTKNAFEKAIEWLEKTPVENDPQSVALRLALWTRLGRPPAEWQPWVAQIKARQNQDGGWSQTPPGQSDAWATGQALFALSHAHSPADRPTADDAISRATAFLMRTQRDDGSWQMASRPARPGDTGAQNLIPITGAGTAWAIIGLAHAGIRSTNSSKTLP